MYCSYKMHFTVLCILLGICVSTKAAKPRSINVVLNTVFEFDKPSDVDFIDQVQGILNKVKNVLKDNPTRNRTERYKFTDFLEDVFDVLQSFNDEDLKEILQMINNEIRQHLQGSSEDNIRRFLNDVHNRFQLRPIKKIKKYLDQLSRNVKNGKHKNNDKNFLSFINTLYKRDSEQKLAKFIRKLKMFRRNNSSLKNEKFQQAVRRLLSSVIFKPFLNQSEDTKRKFVAKIEDYLHNVVYKDADNHSSSQHNEVEALKFNEGKNESNISSGTLDDKERHVSIIQDQNKSRVEAIRDQSDSSKELVKKESIGTSGEVSGETYNAKRNFKRKIKINNKKDPSIKVHRRYQNGKMKQTQYSKESEKRSSGEIIRKQNTKYKIMQYQKFTKNPNLKMTHSGRKFIHTKMLYPKDFENDKLKSVFRNTKRVNKGNIENGVSDEILNDITLSYISKSAEVNVNFKNNKMQFSFKDRDDTVEDTVVRAKDSRQNSMASKAAEKQPDKPKNRQIDSRDSTENRHETSQKRFKTVNRSRRLFRGHNIMEKYLHEAPKLAKHVQDMLNIHKIDNFKKSGDTGKTNIKKSPKIDDFRRRDYILAKELIADKLNAKKELDQNEYYNRSRYAADRTVEGKSLEKFNTININNDISAQKNPDETLASKNLVDDFYIATTKPANEFKSIEVTNHEQQDVENNSAENVANTGISTTELATENKPSYKRSKKPSKMNEVVIKNTTHSRNLLDEFYINNISNVSQNIYSKSIQKLSDKSYIKYDADREILKNIHKSKSTTKQKIKDFYTNNFRQEKIRYAKQKQNGIKSVLNNKSAMFKTDLKPNKAKPRDVRRNFNGIRRKISEVNNLDPVDKILNDSVVSNKKNSTNKSKDSYKKDIDNEDVRKLLSISPIPTAKVNKIIESKNKETKLNVFNITDSMISLNTKPNTKSSTTINTNMNSEILKYELVTKPIVKINYTRELNENEMKSNVTKIIDSRRILSTPKTTTFIDLDANLDDLAFEATMADVNTKTFEVDSTFDIKKYLKNRDLSVGEADPKNEITKKMKEDLEYIFTIPASIATTTAAYTDIFEALENAFDL